MAVLVAVGVGGLAFLIVDAALRPVRPVGFQEVVVLPNGLAKVTAPVRLWSGHFAFLAPWGPVGPPYLRQDAQGSIAGRSIAS